MLLRQMRNGFFSAIFLGLLVAGAFGLMLSDWNGFFRNGVNKTDVAKIDGTPIKIAVFSNHVTKALRAQQIDPAKAYETGMIDNILQGEILRIILKKTSATYGIRVDDVHIAEQIRDIISGFKSEKMTEKEALDRFLQMQGMSERQLVEALRDETSINILKSAIGGASYMPTVMLDNIGAYRNETRAIDYIFVPNSNFKAPKTADDATLQSYYETVKSSYIVPEQRNVTIAILDTNNITKPVVISDADVKARYEEDQKKYQVAERRTMEQVILADKSQAETVAKALKSGTTIESAVKAATKSDKGISGAKDYAQADLPEAVSAPLFAAKNGDVIGPVQTPLGWHVIHLLKTTAPHIEPFENVAAKIKAALQDEKSGDQMYDVTSQIEDRLASGDKFEDMSKDFHLKTITLSNVMASNKDAKELEFAGKNAPAILAKIFASKENESSSLSEASPKLLYSVRVDKIIPAAPKPFAEVKSVLAKTWEADQQAQANMAAAQKLVADINDNKAKLEAQPQKLEHVGELGAKDLGKATLPNDVIYRFMDAAKGKTILAVADSKQGIYIGRVASIKLGSGAIDADLKKKLEGDAANANLALFVSGLQQRYPVVVNHDLIKRTYGNSNKDNQ